MRCGFTRALGRFLEGEFRHWCRQAKLLLSLLGSRGGSAWVLLSTMGQEWEGNLTIRNMASLRQVLASVRNPNAADLAVMTLQARESNSSRTKNEHH